MNAVLPGSKPVVGIIMGSTSDWPTMERATELLETLAVPYEKKVVSAHRTPDRLYEYARTAEERGLKVIIAGAGGAAHLPGMVASMTLLPVVAVPVTSKALNGIDSLLSIAQMPPGVAVATQAIGGAFNAVIPNEKPNGFIISRIVLHSEGHRTTSFGTATDLVELKSH